jgi:hypothetical protein
MRAIAGDAYEMIEGGIGNRLPAAVFVYLCAYGRFMMRCLRAEIGKYNVISQDTDGIWVTDDGLNEAVSKDLIRRGMPGELRLVSSHSYARFFDARHYYCDGRWTLAGIRSGFDMIDSSTVRERQISNPARSGARMLPESVFESFRTVHLDKLSKLPTITDNGWVRPYVLDDFKHTDEHVVLDDSFYDGLSSSPSPLRHTDSL